MSERSSKRWFPLESNPEVMNTYANKLGLDTSSFSFQDVLSIEDWALEMLPRPVVGILLLFPISSSSEAHRRLEEEIPQTVSENVYYMKQTVGNACGTVGILHCIANSFPHGTSVATDSYVERMMKDTAGMNPAERAEWLEQDEEIDAAQEIATAEGQSAQISHEEEVNSHFICFSCVDGCLYELDGRKSGPVNHGPSSVGSLVEDACRVVKLFMERDPEELRFVLCVTMVHYSLHQLSVSRIIQIFRFTIVALAKTPADGDDL